MEDWSLKVRMKGVGLPFVCAHWDSVFFLTIEKDGVTFVCMAAFPLIRPGGREEGREELFLLADAIKEK